MSNKNPPISRPPALDQNSDADAFVSAAQTTPGAAHHSSRGKKLPWQLQRVREDVVRQMTLRLSEVDKEKLVWIAARDPRSMHAIALDAVRAEISKLLKEKGVEE